MRGDRAGFRAPSCTSAEALRGRGSGRSISAYDLHAGLAACSEHLIRFGGHRMAAGVELDADSVDAFRRALAAHAAAALSPDDLIPVERVDAIVPGGDLGLDLAEDLERLRPFGMGNPQPTLLVPAARFERVTGMGEDRGALPVHPRNSRRRKVTRRGVPLTAERARAGPGAYPTTSPSGWRRTAGTGSRSRAWQPARPLPDRAGRDRGARRRTSHSGESSAPRPGGSEPGVGTRARAGRLDRGPQAGGLCRGWGRVTSSRVANRAGRRRGRSAPPRRPRGRRGRACRRSGCGSSRGRP